MALNEQTAGDHKCSETEGTGRGPGRGPGRGQEEDQEEEGTVSEDPSETEGTALRNY